ncbi:hypothetical protein Acr_00g0017690 [Actinidia rufa]|uniref:Uncharacterized protein n=1 Tax=Actinidia rufa TaxID=165716 RepID=A0A7J0DB86_9ERIC|nr:hypothetical protein Acr_00g0017690 [Actinidia rufa]
MVPAHLHASVINFVRTVLVVDTLMRREGLEFGAYDLLHVYIVVRLKWEPDINLSIGNHYLRLQNNQHPWIRLVSEIPNKDLSLEDFVWVLKNWEFWDGDDRVHAFLDVMVEYLMEDEKTSFSTTSGSISLELSSSELVVPIAVPEGEEEVEQEPTVHDGNLAVVDLILVINFDDEAPVLALVP